MSRTYRRKSGSTYGLKWMMEERFTMEDVHKGEINLDDFESVYVHSYWRYQYIGRYRKQSKPGKRQIARFHRDGEIFNSGPNRQSHQMANRRIRQASSREIRKFLLDRCYEVIAHSKPVIGWWAY